VGKKFEKVHGTKTDPDKNYIRSKQDPDKRELKNDVKKLAEKHKL